MAHEEELFPLDNERLDIKPNQGINEIYVFPSTKHFRPGQGSTKTGASKLADERTWPRLNGSVSCWTQKDI
jgi:hypothetical protein